MINDIIWYDMFGFENNVQDGFGNNVRVQRILSTDAHELSSSSRFFHFHLFPFFSILYFSFLFSSPLLSSPLFFSPLLWSSLLFSTPSLLFSHQLSASPLVLLTVWSFSLFVSLTCWFLVYSACQILIWFTRATFTFKTRK